MTAVRDFCLALVVCMAGFLFVVLPWAVGMLMLVQHVRVEVR